MFLVANCIRKVNMGKNLKNSMQVKHKLYALYIKRFLDFIISAIGIVILLPLIGIIFLIVRIKLGSPVIFRQERVGLKKKPFMLYKFRSMSEERDETGQYLPDEVRLGKFGKALRASSCDELPSLLNVIKGDMAIVGPRPLPVRYLPFYTEEESHRHDVRPGITGLAQVNGRNYVTWDTKFQMDLEYVRNISFMEDLKILLKTVIVVFKHEDIETRSQIVHDGVIYQPLDVERKDKHQ